jgi:exonuclease VII large subunit
MTDITQQKQAERELVEAQQRTEEANKLITEKNRTLEALASELRDKNRKVEEQAIELAAWNATLETRVSEQVSQIGRYSRLTRFLSPKVSDLIMSGDSDEPFKARRSEVTVVYVDLRGRDLRSLTIRAGSGHNTFRIHDTPTSNTPGGLTTTLYTGEGSDQVRVNGTTGALLRTFTNPEQDHEHKESRHDRRLPYKDRQPWGLSPR